MPRLALTPRTARRSAWWFVAVFVLGLLAPGISAALAHARGDFSAWQDVCSATAGARQSGDADAALDLLAKGHCPACHIGTADLASPPTLPPPLLRSDLLLQAPERFWRAPVTAHVWRPASARAPPVLV